MNQFTMQYNAMNQFTMQCGNKILSNTLQKCDIIFHTFTIQINHS